MDSVVELEQAWNNKVRRDLDGLAVTKLLLEDIIRFASTPRQSRYTTWHWDLAWQYDGRRWGINISYLFSESFKVRAKVAIAATGLNVVEGQHGLFIRL